MSSPKEKAVELVEKMWVYALPNENGSCQKNAKQCALIAVHEIIEALENNAANSSSWLYYEEVKQEIEKL